MPSAPLRACAGGCGALVQKGRCPACSRVVEQYRGTASQRGYTHAWTRFGPQFIAMLVDAGIPPVCGAALPGGPVTNDSRCKAQGIETYRSLDGSALHRDHEPELQPHERQNIRIVCDPLRLQLLCAACHSAKTANERVN